MPLAQLSASFQSLPLLPTKNLDPSGADSQVGGFVYILGPCGSSKELSCESGSFSCCHNPYSFYSQRFWGFLFPHWNPGLQCLVPQLFLLVYLHANVGLPGPPAATWPTQSSIHHLVEHPFCPGCPSPPLLPVWMNVSSLIPWLLDFHSLISCHFWLIFVFKFVVVLLLVVQGEKVYLPTPPSWPENLALGFINGLIRFRMFPSIPN